MSQSLLTAKQRRLVNELDDISSLLRLNYHKIQEYERASWTPHLQRIRQHFVRGEVVIQYTLVDEFLNDILCRHFFGRKRSFIKLWKTKRFRNFNYFFLEKLSLMEKLAFVRALHEVPKSVRSNIEQLNSLRNGIAHAFFPENLRSSKPRWKGLDIFTLDGIRRFTEDMGEINDYFVYKMTGIHP